MFYTDNNGNILDLQTPLSEALGSLLDDYYNMLSKMTAEQRMNYFKYEQFVEPLRYTQDVDNTTYIVRTLCPPRKNRQKIHAKNRMKRMTNMI